MFNDSIERIRYNNSTLATLTTQNIELEPLRLHQHCPVLNHLKVVQHHARSLYRVIERSWQCQCTTTHSANLCHEARIIDDIALQTHERLIARGEDMDFDVVFSTDSTSTRPLPWSWRETKFRLMSIRDADPQPKILKLLLGALLTVQSCGPNAYGDRLLQLALLGERE